MNRQLSPLSNSIEASDNICKFRFYFSYSFLTWGFTQHLLHLFIYFLNTNILNLNFFIFLRIFSSFPQQVCPTSLGHILIVRSIPISHQNSLIISYNLLKIFPSPACCSSQDGNKFGKYSPYLLIFSISSHTSFICMKKIIFECFLKIFFSRFL